MRLFILSPFSGSVRGLHRFLLTRCAVLVLSGLSGFPGGHFAEGDRVEQAPNEAVAPVAPARPASFAYASSEAMDRSWALSGASRIERLSATRSARGEGVSLEMARLDAPPSDAPMGDAAFGGR